MVRFMENVSGEAVSARISCVLQGDKLKQANVIKSQLGIGQDVLSKKDSDAVLMYLALDSLASVINEYSASTGSLFPDVGGLEEFMRDKVKSMQEME